MGGDGEESIQERFDEYKEMNPIIEYSLIANTKHLPQLEKPGEVLKAIQTYFS